MEGTRIITLGSQVTNSSTSPQFATFEEAFGEYSELFGKKARARRAKRRKSRREDRAKRRKERLAARQDRVADKAEARRMRKKTRREARQQERSERKEARQQMRIERRRKRKAARQAMRAEQQAARMQRRMERRAQRQARKDLEAEREREREDLAMQDYEDQGYDDGYDDDGYDDGGYDDGGYDDGYDDGGYDDGGYDDGGYDDGGYDDGGYDDYETTDDGGYGDDYGTGYDDDYYDSGDPFYADQNAYNPYADTTNSTAYGEYDTGGGGSYGDPYGDQGYYDDGSGNWWQNDQFFGSGSGADYYPMEGPSDDFEYDVDYGFDGSVDEVLETGPSGFDGPVSDGQFVKEMMDGEGIGEYGTAGGGSYVNQADLDALNDWANRIEWNKENVYKLETSSSYLGFTGSRDTELKDNSNRIAQLKEKCRAYVNFEGDSEYMGADGLYKRIPSKRAIMQRMRAVSRAKMAARRKRPSIMKRMKSRPAVKRAMQTAIKSRAKRPNILVKGATPAPRGMMGKSIAKGTATKVEMGLSPKIEPQKITVPARSRFDGFNMDNSDFDMSAMDGKGSNVMRSVPWKEIGIGLAVGVAGIAIYKAVKK